MSYLTCSIAILLLSLSPAYSLAAEKAAKAQSAPAAATNSEAEFLRQAGAGQHELEVGLDYTHHKMDFKVNAVPGTPSNEGKETAVKIQYLYGLDEMFSLGLATGYETSDDTTKMAIGDSTTEGKGMKDVTLLGMSRHPLGDGTLRVKLAVNMALADKEEEDVSATATEENVTKGYTFADLQLGYALPISGGHVGAALTYGIYQGEGKMKDIDANTSLKFDADPNMALDVFYEQAATGFLWGVDVQYSLSGDVQFKDGTNTNIDPGQKVYTVSGYFNIPLGEGQLLPTVNYAMVQSSGNTTTNNYAIDGGTVYGLGVGYRAFF